MKRILLFLLLCFCLSALNVPTAQYSNARTGSNTSETILTPTAITSSYFRLLGNYTVDGSVYSQPLYISGVIIGGLSYDVLIVTTMHDSIYAFDADRPGTSPLWSNLAFDTSSSTFVGNEFYSGEVGCISTPVIDTMSQVIYSVCANASNNWVIRSFNLVTGALIHSTAITATVAGIGDGGSTVSIDGGLQRAPLALANGNVYVAFAGAQEIINWHGFVVSYDESTLTQQAAFCTTPNGAGGGIWEAGGGIAVDGSGNLYVVTGNGSYDGVANFGQSVIKLSSSLTVIDWFTPSDESSTSGVDADLSSGRQMLIPGTTYLSIAGKDFIQYLVDTTNMGHLQGSGQMAQAFNVIAGTPSCCVGVFGGLFMNNIGYWPIVSGNVYAFQFDGVSTYNTTSIANTNTGQLPFPGGVLSGSSNGTQTGIVWAVESLGGQTNSVKRQAKLHAFDPQTLTEIWHNADSDAPGEIAKFSAPVIINGRVYLSSIDNKVSIFGLLPEPGIVIP